MKIHALISVYNASETIFECLKSLVPVVDRIVILEGKWIGFGDETMPVTSSDSTEVEIQEFIERFGKQIEIDYFAATEEHHQYEARTFLLDQVPHGDWFFVIDSDEIITKFPQNLREILEHSNERGYRCGQLDEKQESGPRPFPHPRLLRKTEGMKYEKNHRKLIDNDGALCSLEFPSMVQLVIYHKGCDKAMRSIMENYKSWLFDWEQSNFIRT